MAAKCLQKNLLDNTQDRMTKVINKKITKIVGAGLVATGLLMTNVYLDSPYIFSVAALETEQEATSQEATTEYEEQEATSQEATTECEEQEVTSLDATTEYEEQTNSSGETESLEIPTAMTTLMTTTEAATRAKETITTTDLVQRTRFKKFTVKRKIAILRWYQASKVSGYQIKYSKNKNFQDAKVKNIVKRSIQSYTVKKLEPGKRYYFRIRCYRRINNMKVYGKWSAIKTIRCLR